MQCPMLFTRLRLATAVTSEYCTVTVTAVIYSLCSRAVALCPASDHLWPVTAVVMSLYITGPARIA